MHLVIINKAAMDSLWHTGARRQIEHIAMAEQLLCHALIENSSGVDLGGYLEGNSGRHIGFDQAGYNIDRGSLSGQY